MKPIYLLVGVPGSGKTWVTERVGSGFHHISHDANLGRDYTEVLLKAAQGADKPVLAETPFSMSKIIEPVTKAGCQVIPVIVTADTKDLSDRWNERNTSPVHRKGHITRQATFVERATASGHFQGSSTDVLAFLKKVSG